MPDELRPVRGVERFVLLYALGHRPIRAKPTYLPGCACSWQGVPLYRLVV
jgi:hypothetical protein